MSEENEAVEVNEIITPESAEVEQVEHVEQEAPEAEVQPEAPQQTELTEAARKAVNKKHFQYKEEERRANELQRQIDSMKQQQAPQEIVIPPIPDQYELDADEYAQKMAERDALMLQKNNHDAQLATHNAQLQHQQQQQFQKHQLEMAEASKELTKKAQAAQMSEEDLNQAAKTIGDYNLGAEFARELMHDDSAIEIIKYLANDPLELDKISKMNDYQKGVHMGNIRKNAQALKPKQSSTPKPPSDISGSGQDPDIGKYPHSKGAKIW